MYTKEKRVRVKKRKEKKSFGAGLMLAFLSVTAAAAEIYAFMVMAAFAAPKNPGLEATVLRQEEMEERDVSGNGIAQEEDSEEEERPHIPLIVVDAGHGGVDIGCMEEGIVEKDINLQIALRVRDRLEDKGFLVIMSRDKDEYLSPEERVELANDSQADACVSIHQNTYEGSDKSVGGIEAWYDGADSARDNERLAYLVHQETVKSTGAPRRELWDTADFCVTNKTRMPACLIETGFLSNPEENLLLSSPEYQEKIAEGIAEGIALYFHSK